MAQTDRNGASTTPANPPQTFRYRPGGWGGGVTYLVYDVTRNNGAQYICLVEHVSEDFMTDLAMGLWELFVDKGLSGSGSGDMVGANNLLDVVSAAASRANIGAAASGVNSDITDLTGLNPGALPFSVLDGVAAEGDIAASGLTTGSGVLLGRVSGGAGAVEEITLGSGLAFDGNTLELVGASLFYKVVSTSSIALNGANLTTGYSAIGSSFSMDIPTSGFISLRSLTARFQNNAAAGAHNTVFGIRIGSANYWFAQTSSSGSLTLATQVHTGTSASSYLELNGSPLSLGIVTNGSEVSAPVIDIEALSVPTGTQTVQLIAGYTVNAVTLRGDLKTTRVVVEVVGLA